MSTLIHHPNFPRRAADSGMVTNSLLDCITGINYEAAHEAFALGNVTTVIYPAPRQTNIPLYFSAEIPDPIPAHWNEDAGFPITVTSVLFASL